MIRVLLAEDQAMVRGALSALLNLESDIDVVGTAADGEEAWRALQQLMPDLLVTDIEMPGLTGLELAQRVQRHELACKVVIVTTFARPGFLRRALEAGVGGYLLKDSPAEQLADALRKVHRGGRAIDPQLAVEAWSDADPLNDRERQVLRLAGEGRSAGDIAERLNLSQGTVRNYLSRRSASSASATASRHIGWRGRKAGCNYICAEPNEKNLSLSLLVHGRLCHWAALISLECSTSRSNTSVMCSANGRS